MDLFKTGIRPQIDDWLLMEAAKKRDYGPYWSASSAGYCMRKVIFERLKIPYSTVEPRKQRIFTAGHIFHEWIQGITKQAGISIAQELELIDDGLMVKGHIDDLVLVNDNLILYDYKTRNSRSFNFASQPNELHEMQLGTYLYMLRNGGKFEADTDKGIKGGVLSHDGTIVSTHTLTEARTLNIEKDNLRQAEVQYMWTPELEKKVYQYWSTLSGYWKAKTIPKCTCETFMASEKYNPFFWKGEPCSEAWAMQHKELVEGFKC